MLAKVFGTYELLETILHALPTRDLLLHQRVCRTWRDVIERSQKLQRALFFLPVQGRLLENNFEHDPDWAHLWSYPAHPTIRMQIFENPLLQPLHSMMAVQSPATLEERLPPVWARPEASWRGMLLSQPASLVDIAKEYANSVASREVVRAGEILEVVELYGPPAPREVYFALGIGCWSKLRDHGQLEMLPREAPVLERSEDDERSPEPRGFQG